MVVKLAKELLHMLSNTSLSLVSSCQAAAVWVLGLLTGSAAELLPRLTFSLVTGRVMWLLAGLAGWFFLMFLIGGMTGAGL